MNKPDTLSQDLIETIYSNVFRQSTEKSGYYYINLGTKMNSKEFRQFMIKIKNELNKLCKTNLNKELNYQSLGRFNHQHTSKPHRDTASDHSFLMLGYEPTAVDSTVYITDYSKYIEQENISIDSFFEEDKEANLVFNISPFKKYIKEIKPFNKSDYRIIIANNSRSYQEKTFGVFHSAEIPKKTDNEDRIINYMMLKLSKLNSIEQYTIQNVEEFLNTQKVSR